MTNRSASSSGAVDADESSDGTGTPHLARITRYPIKSLDPVSAESVRLDDGPGAVAGDREYAIVDADGEFVNGKRTAAVHRLRASFDAARRTVTFREVSADADEGVDADDGREPDEGVDADDGRDADNAKGSLDVAKFVLDSESGRADAAAWLSDYFGYEVRLRRRDPGGFPDDTALPGPTVISTATLREVADWFDLDLQETRLRFRANLEIGGVPPFWEDRLVADHWNVVRFRIGETPLHGVNPCQRCVVPSRDPSTGEELAGFRETFVEKRRETLPEWTDSDRFDHYFRVMVNTAVPSGGRGSRLTVGDPVVVDGVRPESDS